MARKSPVSGRSGSVRIQRLSGVALSAAEAHGKRLDRNGKARSVNDEPPITTTGLDLNDLYERHIEGDPTDGLGRAKVHKSTTKALHMLLQFPTDLVGGEDGERLLSHARRFAETVFGDAAIFADRVDRDEKSQHVVDLMLTPKYVKETKRSASYAVSTSVHLKKLAAKYGKAPTLRGQGQALQDAWFEYLRDAMGLDVARGSAKTRPGDDWQTPEELEAERIRDNLEAEMNEELFPDPFAPLRPPTPESRIVQAIVRREEAKARQILSERMRKENEEYREKIKAIEEDKSKKSANEYISQIKKLKEELSAWENYFSFVKLHMKMFLSKDNYNSLVRFTNEKWDLYKKNKKSTEQDQKNIVESSGPSGP